MVPGQPCCPDFRIPLGTLKAFVLLTDVDDSMGPLTYLRRSRAGGEHGRLFQEMLAN